MVVKIYDTFIKDPTDAWGQYFDYSPSYLNKDNWKQVPYGTTNYSFVGNCVIESDKFYLFLHNRPHGPLFSIKKSTPYFPLVGELYSVVSRTNYSDCWNSSNKKWTITENTINKCSVIEDSYSSACSAGINLAKYTVKSATQYIEVSPGNSYKYKIGSHNRRQYAIIPSVSGTDLKIDTSTISLPINTGQTITPPTGSYRMLVEPLEDGCMAVMMYDSIISSNPNIRVYRSYDESYPKIEALWATAQLGTDNKRVIIGFTTYNTFSSLSNYNKQSLIDLYNSVDTSIPTETWDCMNNACVINNTGTGTYSSLVACQAACGTQLTYDCINEQCIVNSQGTGQFSSLSECKAVCQGGVTELDMSAMMVAAGICVLAYKILTERDMILRK